jgi:hypothetical protein
LILLTMIITIKQKNKYKIKTINNGSNPIKMTNKRYLILTKLNTHPNNILIRNRMALKHQGRLLLRAKGRKRIRKSRKKERPS